MTSNELYEAALRLKKLLEAKDCFVRARLHVRGINLARTEDDIL